MNSLVFWGGYGWDDGTAMLYIGIGCLVGFLSFVSSRAKDARQSFVLYALVTLTLILFKGACVSGVDVKFGGGYYLNFISAESLSAFRDKSVELGFQLLTVGIRCFTDRYEIYLLIVAAISIVPVMYVFWKLRGELNLSFAVMGYSLFFVVTGMSAMRQFMAVGLGLLAVYYFFTKRYKQSLIVLVAAVSIHISALCLVLLFVFMITKERRFLQVFLAFLVVGLCVIGQAVIGGLLTGRYAIYSVAKTSGFGAAVLLKYLPIFFLLFAVETRVFSGDSGKKPEVLHFADCWAVLIFAVCIALIGYVVPIFGRAESFSLPLVVVIAYLIRLCEKERYFRIPVKALAFGYFCFRFLLYMNDVYLAEGLMPYLTCFN